MIDQEILDKAALERGDILAIKKALRARGLNTLLVKGLDTPVRFQCKRARWWHEFTASPREAIESGCPHCELERHIAEDPPERITEAALVKGIKAQEKFLVKQIDTARRRSRQSGHVARYI